MKKSMIMILATILTMGAVLDWARMRTHVSAQARTGDSGQRQKRFSPEQERALRELAPKLTQFYVGEDAVPSWLTGDLGTVAGSPDVAALEAIKQLTPIFRMTSDDRFEVGQVSEDEAGQAHVRLQQHYRNLPVLESELIVHLNGRNVVGVNGRFTPDINLGLAPVANSEVALRVARRSLSSGEFSELSRPELVIFVTPDGAPHLSWRQKATFADDEGGHREWIFADARSGELLGRRSLIQTAKFRKIYDANQACLKFSSQLPGNFLWDENVLDLTGADTEGKGAFSGTGQTYDFFKQVFNRDSYDGAGSPLVSSVHAKFASGNICTPNNAAWYEEIEQMAYGDGDGIDFSSLSQSLDVTAHELTHGVTSWTAKLVYKGESGAINEATSDILGESVDYFINGSADWKIGEDIYTPGKSGDALRYMDNPSLDDPDILDGGQCKIVSSRDYYPDRYTGQCDYGGVHINSGIANLAFYLMSVGGTHPKSKTSVVVPAIGIEQARQIWYEALRHYMGPTTDFADARNATAAAASALYGCKTIKPAIVAAVHKAWDAVGVPNASQNGLAMLGFSGPIFSPVWPCPRPSHNLVLNPSFDKGSEIWRGNTEVITNSGAYPAHSGAWKAWLGGDGAKHTDTLYQQVTIPSVAKKARFFFRLRIDTTETTNTVAYDKLEVQLRDSSNNVLTTLKAYSNLNKNSGYVLESFDLSAYKGKTVRVTFVGAEDFSKQTSFIIDDVYLQIE